MVAMRSSIVCGLAVSAALAGAARAAKQRPVEPGGKIGVMTVVRGDAYDADVVMVGREKRPRCCSRVPAVRSGGSSQ
jgi:hypothetical protein